MKKLRCKSEIKKMAGAAAVTLGALGFYFLAPSGYIALDLNPSIEIRTNRLDQVVSVKAVNEDAKRLLADYKVTACVTADAGISSNMIAAAIVFCAPTARSSTDRSNSVTLLCLSMLIFLFLTSSTISFIS